MSNATNAQAIATIAVDTAVELSEIAAWQAEMAQKGIETRDRWRVIYRATVRAETPRPPNGPDPIPDVWVVERYAWGRWRPLCQHTRHRDAMLCVAAKSL